MNSSKEKKRRIRVEIFSKDDCSLCDKAKAVLLDVQPEFDFELQEIDITQNPTTFERFKEEIPVIFINGRKAFKYHVQPEALRKKLRRLHT